MSPTRAARTTRNHRQPGSPPAPPIPGGLWSDPSPGLVLGQFRIERRLGRGGMNSVFLARHVITGARVAIKVPNFELAHDKEVTQRLATEGRVLTTLRHPNIVMLFDSATGPGGVPYLLMEYLEGQLLASSLPQRMGIQAAVHVLSQLCEALEAAHRAGVVHRDVKPENIFIVHRLDAPMTVKLLDFGIARLLREQAGRTDTAIGAVLGTPDYMPPEQMMGERVGHQADLYSLGVVGYQLLTGALPFSSLREKVFTPPVPFSAFRPDVPPALARTLLKALAPDLAVRFQSAQQMREELVRVLSSRPALRSVTAQPQQISVGVFDLAGADLATCNAAVLVPGGAWLCTSAAAPRRDQQVLLTLPGHQGFVSARVVSNDVLPQPVRDSLPSGFLVEFPRLETSARLALSALKPEPAAAAAG